MAVRHVRAADIEHDRPSIEHRGFTASIVRFDAGAGRSEPWHHHGEHHLVAYVIAGAIRIESGPGGTLVTEFAPGDLIHIEPRTVHRETYEGRIELVGFSSGTGVGRVDVAMPDLFP
ncbi:MAG TPA: cupin domain-containing protein [Actinomycetota bacterium]|nr:cupin domain-containing protein [Actinomycetota bacterium]